MSIYAYYEAINPSLNLGRSNSIHSRAPYLIAWSGWYACSRSRLSLWLVAECSSISIIDPLTSRVNSSSLIIDRRLVQRLAMFYRRALERVQQ